MLYIEPDKPTLAIHILPAQITYHAVIRDKCMQYVIRHISMNKHISIKPTHTRKVFGEIPESIELSDDLAAELKRIMPVRIERFTIMLNMIQHHAESVST